MLLFRAPYPREWLVLCPVIWEAGISMAFPKEKGACLWSRLCPGVWQRRDKIWRGQLCGGDLALCIQTHVLFSVISHLCFCLLYKTERMFVTKLDVFPTHKFSETKCKIIKTREKGCVKLFWNQFFFKKNSIPLNCSFFTLLTFNHPTNLIHNFKNAFLWQPHWSIII